MTLQSCPALCDPMDCSPSGSSVHGDSPGENTGVGCYALLLGIFPSSHTSNPHLLQPLHWYVGPIPLAPPGKPGFYHRTVQINRTYTYITSFLSLPPLLPSHPSGLSQSTRLGSLCCTHQLLTSYLFYAWQCIYILTLLAPFRPRYPFPTVPTTPSSISESPFLSCE